MSCFRPRHSSRNCLFSLLLALIAPVITPIAKAQTPPQGGTCPTIWQPSFQVDPQIYPFTHRCIVLGFGNYHYIDELPIGTPRGTVLMVHGNPTWSFLYRNLATMLLTEGYRVIAVDHYGYGLSDKPSSSIFGYSPTEQSTVLTNFVKALQLQNLTLVVQDWGGPIGLNMAEKLPNQIKNILVMNTWAWPLSDNPSLYHSLMEWSSYSQKNQSFLTSTAYMPKQTGINISSSGLNATLDPTTQTNIRNAYWAPFLNTSTGQPLTPTVAAPTVTLANSIVPPDPKFLTSLRDNLSKISSKPVYFLFGRLDPNFGALTPSASSCAPNTFPSTVNGITYCLDNTTQNFVYPYFDRFCSLWATDKVYGAAISQSSSHFIQEYIPQTLVQAVNTLNDPLALPVPCVANPLP